MTDLQLNKLRYTFQVALKALAHSDRALATRQAGVIPTASAWHIDNASEMKEIDSALKLLDRLDVGGDKVE